MEKIKDKIIIDYLAANGKEIDTSLPFGFGHGFDKFKEGIHFYLMPNESLVLGAYKNEYCQSPIIYDMRSNGVEVRYENHKCWHALIVVKHSFRLNTLLASGLINSDKIESNNGNTLQRDEFFLAIDEQNGKLFVLRRDKTHLLYLGTTYAEKAVITPILNTFKQGNLRYTPKPRKYCKHGGYTYIENKKIHLVTAISENDNLVRFSTKYKYVDFISESEYEQRVYEFLINRNYEFTVLGNDYTTSTLKKSEIVDSINQVKAYSFFYFGKIGKIAGYRAESNEFLMRNIFDKNDLFVAKIHELKSLVLKQKK